MDNNILEQYLKSNIILCDKCETQFYCFFLEDNNEMQKKAFKHLVKSQFEQIKINFWRTQFKKVLDEIERLERVD